MTDWKSDLGDFLNNREQRLKDNEEKLERVNAEVKEFYSKIVIPAFEELEKELQKHKRETRICSTSIIVTYRGEQEIEYEIKVIAHPHTASVSRIAHFRAEDGTMYTSEGPLPSGSKNYPITNITKDDVITDFLSNYKDHLRHL
jgi:hypothetical protein